MKTRQEMINEIIENETEVNFSDPTYIREILLTGFGGYDNMSDSEIQGEWDDLQEILNDY